MDLPVEFPMAPILAKAARTLPEGDGWVYEPKWDGFRCIIFRDGDDVELCSRSGKPLTRYFPEIVAEARSQLPRRCVIDGELVIQSGDRLEFEMLQARIHPAASRVALLQEQTPASYVVFDMIADGDEDLTAQPLAVRRDRLATALDGVGAPFYATPSTADPAVAHDWFDIFEGAGLDGVIAKPLDSTYQPGKRVFVKLKHQRTADCVLVGFRWHKSGPVVGSLLLGLYDERGGLQFVGAAAAFTMERRAELVDELAPYRDNALVGHPWRDWQSPQENDPERMPGAVSRWNSAKDLSWQPLRPERVVEVQYDQLEGSRFRHVAKFVRWRDDREAASCRFDQLDIPVSYDLADVLSAGTTPRP